MTFWPTMPRSQASSWTSAGNVVVADEEDVERQVLAEADELVTRAAEAQPAAREEIQGVVGQPAGFLDRNLEARRAFPGHRWPAARRAAAME